MEGELISGQLIFRPGALHHRKARNSPFGNLMRSKAPQRPVLADSSGIRAADCRQQTCDSRHRHDPMPVLRCGIPIARLQKGRSRIVWSVKLRAHLVRLIVMTSASTLGINCRKEKIAMRKLIAMALLGVGAVVFSATAPATAMPTGNAAAGAVKQAAGTGNAVEEVGRRHRHWRHRHHRHWRHHHHHRRYYRPYYYGGYYPYYYYPRYYRRPGIHLHFRF
jgi:hypothetical protein